MSGLLRLRRMVAALRDDDMVHAFLGSPQAIVAALITVVLIAAAAAAPWISPTDPWDPRGIDLMDALTPPSWWGGGDPRFLLGTDSQGRDLLSSILYGMRVSVLVGFVSVAVALAIGIAAGLLAGWVGGVIDAVVMRLVDVQMTFPAILVALLVDGVTRAVFPKERHEDLAIPVVVLSLALSIWPQIARTVRGSTLVEKNREYVQAARVIGRSGPAILLRHVLPNVLGPVLVIATINLAVAILGEATLSYLGVGVSPTRPSLGTMIRIGNDFLFSGELWIVVFPGLTLALLVLSVNLLGDWLRDVLDPKLR